MGAYIKIIGQSLKTSEETHRVTSLAGGFVHQPN